jgi:AcrR family transcriptional regulator
MKSPEKRAEIMQVALELLAEHGFHRVPMSMIAEKANVAVGTIYIYFASKDELITGLFLDLERKIIAAFRDGFSAAGPMRERYLYLTREVLLYFINNPLHFRYLEQYTNSPYGITMHRDRFLGKPGHDDILMNFFEEGISQHVMKSLPMVVLFSVSFAPLIFLARDHILGFINLDEDLIRQVTEACWDAIKR